jgi:hypothetical protein
MVFEILSPKQLVTIWGKSMALVEIRGPYSCLKIGDPPRGRTENLLIKSQLLFVHRRVQQSIIGTILRLTAKTEPSGQK